MSESRQGERVYLDHAATSWPKPPGVVQAYVDYQETCGAAAGRGSYVSASKASQVILSGRRKLAQLIHADSPNDIAFVHNGTAALNLALCGILRPGDHVVTTAAEHNSVLRPLAMLRAEIGIEFTIVPTDATGWVNPMAIEKAIEPATRWIAITHASNVTGTVQAVEEISAIAQRRSVHLLLDAAQTLGYLPIDVRKMGIDMLAAPGHKGACGVLGTGMLYAQPEIAKTMRVPWPGGTGSESDRLEGPFAWPTGFESGNVNVPALAAWNAGLDWLMAEPIETRWNRAQQQRQRLRAILDDFPLGSVIAADSDGIHVPVVSFASNRIPCSELASIFDSSFRIEVRSGLHCAAKIHECLRTEEAGGTLRFSLGHTSTDADLDALAVACRELRLGLL